MMSQLDCSSGAGEGRSSSSLMLESLDDESLQHVLEFLSWQDLAALKCTNSRLRAAAEEAEADLFQRVWGLEQRLAGTPRKPLAAFRVGDFVLPHAMRRGDSSLSLGLKYGVAPAEIRVLNNVISEHSLQSRSTAYIPATDAAAQVRGKVAWVVRDPFAMREHVVVCPQGQRRPEHAIVTALQSRRAAAAEGGGQEDAAAAGMVPAAAQRAAAVGAGAQGAAEAGGAGGLRQRRQSAAQHEQMVQRLSAMVSKGLHIDDDTARFYILESGLDVKSAIELYRSDSSWEQEEGGPLLRHRRGSRRAVR